MNKFLLSFLFFCGFASFAFAQENGTIRGAVNDQLTGEALPFLTVAIKDSNPPIGVATDMDGNYEIRIAPGTYALEFSYVGYSNQVIEGVVVTENKITLIDASMSEAVLQATEEEIVIRAEKIDRTENALLNMQRKAIRLQDGISAQEISRYSSNNAADAVKRVSGASIVDGKYVYLRGIGDRYNSTQLNGLMLPSTDPYRNATQLDLIPSNLLDNIIASKSFTPDLPGNTTGGSLDIATKSFPETFLVDVSVSASYNQQSNLRNDFLTYSGGSTDWLGYDDGTRALPEDLNNQELFDLLAESGGSASLLRNKLNKPENAHLAPVFDNGMKALNPQFKPVQGNSFLNHGASFTLGTQETFLDNPLGILFSVSYNRQYSAYQGGGDLTAQERINFFTEDSAVPLDQRLANLGGVYSNYSLQLDNNNGTQKVTGLRNELAMLESVGKESPSLGGMFGLAYKFGAQKTNKITFNALYNHNAEKSAFSAIGKNPDVLSANKLYEVNTLFFNEREIQNYQLSGEHLLAASDVKIDWSGSYTISAQTEPDGRALKNSLYFSENLDENGDLVVNTLWGITPSAFNPPFHFWRDLQDKQIAGKVDVTFPFLKEQSKNNKIKVGGMYSYKTRRFSDRTIEFKNEKPIDGMNFTQAQGDDLTFFAPENVGIIDQNDAKISSIGLYSINNEEAILRNSYDGHEGIYAVYGMANYELGRLKIIGGARMEMTDIFVESLDTSQAKGEINVVDVLPSLNLIYPLSTKMNLRAAAYQTVARPNMRELAPFESFDRAVNFLLFGNPDLQRTNISNFDLRWEWFPNAGELLAVSTFYKRFENPIVKSFLIESKKQIQFQNVDNADVYGVEFEFRKSLEFITSQLKDFRLITNVSLIKSVVDIPEGELAQIEAFQSDKGTTRPLQGQSPYMVNVALNYNNSNRGFEASIAYNVFGKRLVVNNRGAAPDFYEQAYPTLDIMMKKKLGDKFSLRLSANNLLNPYYQQEIETAGITRIIERHQNGTSFGIGLSYTVK